MIGAVLAFLLSALAAVVIVRQLLAVERVCIEERMREVIAQIVAPHVQAFYEMAREAIVQGVAMREIVWPERP